ncbi:hypothetical protein PMAYCL1PPCAC_25318, partial [Pristionchus mayeri]
KNRKGKTNCVCVVKDKRNRACRIRDDDKLTSGFIVKTFIFIYLTKVTGVRKSALFDFTTYNPLNDATLIVEGKEIHVNKQYLSSVSTEFRSLFDTHANSTILLEGVKYQDCIDFLRWIHPTTLRNYNKDEMSRVVALAKRFNALSIIDQIAKCIY